MSPVSVISIVYVYIYFNYHDFSASHFEHENKNKNKLQSEAITPMERRVRRAAQCAFAIQDELHNCELAVGVRLSVKIGIGMGKVSVLHLGGVHKRMEYIAVGEPLLQAFTAEHHATPGDVRISLYRFVFCCCHDPLVLVLLLLLLLLARRLLGHSTAGI